MSQEASEVRLVSLSLQLDLETGELQGLLTLQTALGELVCPTDPEVVQELMSLSMSGPQSQSSSNSLPDFLEPEPPRTQRPMFTPMDEPSENLLDFHLTNGPRRNPVGEMSPQDEIEDLDTQVRNQLLQAAKQGTPRKLGVEMIENGSTFEEEENGKTKVP